MPYRQQLFVTVLSQESWFSLLSAGAFHRCPGSLIEGKVRTGWRMLLLSVLFKIPQKKAYLLMGSSRNQIELFRPLVFPVVMTEVRFYHIRSKQFLTRLLFIYTQSSSDCIL